jgi:hypothetical protein
LLGPSRRTFWKAETMVDPLANVAGAAVGAPANSAVFPPLTDVIARTLGS